MAPKYPLPTDDSRLTAIAVAYKNSGMIATEVAPIVKVKTESFKYNVYGKESFSVPETQVSRRGEVGEVNFKVDEKDGSTEDHGLKTKIPQKDIDAQVEGEDVVGNNTESLTEIITLRNEVQVAGIIQNAANYATDNKETLSGTDQWSDPTSDPVRAILAAKENSLVDFNIASMGSVVWNYLRLHPKVIAYVYGALSTSGSVTKAQFAEVFEFEQILIGKGWANTASLGQTPTMVKTWVNHFAMQHRNRLATTKANATFAYTASYQPKGVERTVASKVLDPMDFGIDGGVQIGIGEHKKALVTANDYGYLFTDATDPVFSA